ncbi:MAG: multidrug effflux MFS transporter, partial [Alphaproteobacteria bacterium]|nr:multidrug effflux MFS transporter [Alphaproteobacteria bacterium]
MNSAQPSQLLLPILCLLMALGFFSTAIYLPSFPAIGETLHASREQVQQTLALFFLGSAVGGLILGPFADRMGRLVVAKGGIILFVLASFWCAESYDIFNLQIARFLQGFAAGSGPLVVRAIGRDLYEGADLTRFSATTMMVASFSPAIAPTLGGFLQSVFGWKYNFYFLMGFGIMIAVMVWKWLPETKPFSEEKAPLSSILKNYVTLFKDPSYSLFCLVIGLQMGSIFCYVTFSPYLFITHFNFSPTEYGALGIVGAFGNVSGFNFARYLAHRIQFHQGIFIGSFLCLCLSVVLLAISLLFSATALTVILFSLGFYAASALAVVNASAAAMSLFPRIAGMASAMVGSIQIGS